jgi:hypothetical protein
MGDLSAKSNTLPDPAWREQLMLFSEQSLDYDRMERWFAPVAEFAARTGAPIYCSEFGCWDPAPLDSQLNWFRDVLKLFDRHGVAWAQWQYKCLYTPEGQARPPVSVLFDNPASRTNA